MNKKEFDKALKLKLIEVFDYTIQFLESHNLRWYVCGGTAIGAIRHHNIIPWDDDIDIFMPREDYDRLLLLKQEMDSSNYKLYSYYDERYYHPYYKVVNTNTTIWETRSIPCILGVYVDIFPLEDTDITPHDYSEIYNNCAKIWNKYQRSLTKPTARMILDYFKHFHFKSLVRYLFNFLFYSWRRKYLLTKYIMEEKRYYCPQGKYYTHPYGYCGPYKEIYKKEWFSDVDKCPFDRLVVNVPIGYHEYLSQVFGDYMTPPPVEKRVDTHGDSRYYINLKERVDNKEIERRVAKGITREY